MQGVSYFYTSMLSKFNRNLTELVSDLSKAKLFIAVSGGIDSVVLTHLCIQQGLSPHLLHCNFQLRNEESDEDETFVKHLAESNHLKYTVKHFDTKRIAEANNIGIQECARHLRYEWFNTYLTDEDSYVLTAHHLDDSIETFHINTLRGTGIKGLLGIPRKRGQIIRPFINFTKFEIANFSKNKGIEFREDSSNTSDKYLRNKIRHHIVPQLEDLTEGYKQKMETLMTELNEVNDFIEQFVKDFKRKHFGEKSNQIIELDLIQNFSKTLISKLFSEYEITRANSIQLLNLFKAQTGAEFFNSKFYLSKKQDTVTDLQAFRCESNFDKN